MVEDLKSDNVSRSDIEEGLRFLDTYNGWAFVRWISGIEAKYRSSKKAKLLEFAMNYLTGNIRVVEVANYKGDAGFDRKSI